MRFCKSQKSGLKHLHSTVYMCSCTLYLLNFSCTSFLMQYSESRNVSSKKISSSSSLSSSINHRCSSNNYHKIVLSNTRPTGAPVFLTGGVGSGGGGQPRQYFTNISIIEFKNIAAKYLKSN